MIIFARIVEGILQEQASQRFVITVGRGFDGRMNDMQEDITYCANTDCKNMDWDKQNNKVLQRAFEKFKGLLEEGQ